VIIVGSANASVGMKAGWDILASGGSSLDAVEAVVRDVESNPEDHTVGYGGYPNLLGQVELDASIMDGTGRRSGSVGALQDYRHAITVARAVMERTPHVFIVGAGAARLAADIGLERENLLTPDVEKLWREQIRGQADAAGSGLRLQAAPQTTPADPEEVGGTVNVLAIDRHGHIASAVSTSGWAWKHPGRLGDSPVIGAGNYADSRYGAACCTGWGELTVRAGTARVVVSALARGVPLYEACVEAMRDLSLLAGVEDDRMPVSVVAVDAAGNHCSISSSEGREYVLWADGMDDAMLLERRYVPLLRQRNGSSA
jgi:beta-aspartyl-peptidase (threonine type)